MADYDQLIQGNFLPTLIRDLSLPEVDLDGSVYATWEELYGPVAPLLPPYLPVGPAALVVGGQNVLISHHGGALFGTLRRSAPRWCRVATEAYIAMYCWHGTTNARPLLPALANVLISQSVESHMAINPTWSVESVVIQIGHERCVTSQADSKFMTALRNAITAAQEVFYNRTMQAVGFLVLPCTATQWQHAGLIPYERPSTREEISYVRSLVSWNPCSGFNVWHDFRPNAAGELELRWFDRRELKHLMDTAHFGVGSPGYLYIQEVYSNQETGGEEWGPLTSATFHSTTWILAAVDIYLCCDVLNDRHLAADHFTSTRRDAIVEKQCKIAILLRQILRQSVPGLTATQSEAAYFALHDFMHTNPSLPFLI